MIKSHIQIFFTLCAIKLLELGYTTIRDCGDNSCRGTVALSRSIEAGRLVGPTIIPCGLILCPTAPSTSDGLAECIDGVDNTRQMARRALLKGAKFLKLYGSASMMAPTKETGYPIIEPEEIREAVKVAENYSTYVSIHSHGARAMDQAIRAGVHTVEHASLISEETLQYIDENRKDFGIVPTLAVVYGTMSGDPHINPEVQARSRQKRRPHRRFGRPGRGYHRHVLQPRARHQGRQADPLSRRLALRRPAVYSIIFPA